MTTNTITIREYLTQKGIEFQDRGGELIARCLFGGCDDDSRANERHLYFNAETGQYECKKCGEKGNLITLQKHFGEDIKSSTKPASKSPRFNVSLVDKCHEEMPPSIRKYLNDRGIIDPVINQYKLGYGSFYGKSWITIPIKNELGEYVFFKLRQDPEQGNEKITYLKGEAQLYDWETLNTTDTPLVLCEGEMDRLLLLSHGINAVTSTHGAGTFKQPWIAKLKNASKIFVCYDNDEAGRKGAVKVLEMLDRAEVKNIYNITLPPEVGEGGDVTDFVIKLNGNPADLLEKFSKPYPEKIDERQFEPMSAEVLSNVLGLTIKKDEVNKVVTFQCMLSAFTDSNQFNISFNAPSSTGKSYIPLEISSLFPAEDLLKLGSCSPTAFFHEEGEVDKENNIITVDLARKIIIFMDQPNNELLKRMRSLLSHDQKEIESKMTDKNQRGGNRTKTVILKGFPAVVFCSAGLSIDEQEGTRFLLLSPEMSQEKLRASIMQKIRKESDEKAYYDWLDADPARQLLKLRIRAIKQEKIQKIIIPEAEAIEQFFLDNKNILKPRHQRDVGRLITLTKAFALLNVWFRRREGDTVYASMEDIEEAARIWDKIAESQEHNLPPYTFNLFKDVIVAAWQDKNTDEYGPKLGVTQQEIITKHLKVYGTLLPDWQLRQHILPMLEAAGLITKEQNEKDKRQSLITPVMPSTEESTENYSELGDGVEITEENV